MIHPVKLIRLEVFDQGDNPVEDVLIEDHPETGLEIRTRGQSKLLAGPWTIVELDHSHCSGCRADKTIGELLGLTDWEVETIGQWREIAKQPKGDREVSAKMLGEVLDKIVKGLEEDAPGCETVYERVKLKVEHEP
jgi:hypothetical protein